MSIFDELGVPDPDKPKKTVFDEIGIKAPEKKPAPPVSETIGDYARRFAQGAASWLVAIPGAIAERFGASPSIRQTGERLEEQAKNLGGGMSPGAQAVDASTFLGGEGEFFGPYPIRKALSAVTQSAPGMIGLAVAGRAPAQALAQADVGGKVAGALTRAGAPKVVGKVVGEAVESAPFWIGEGLQAGGEASIETGKRLRDPSQTPTDKMAQTEAFQSAMVESLRANPSLTAEQHIAAVREAMAKQASNEVFDKTAASTGLIGAATGAGALGVWNRRLNGIGPQDGYLRNIAASMFREGVLQEAPQSGGEQLISNYITRKFANPEQSLTENLGEATALGAVSGAALGAGMATVTHPFTRRDAPLAPPTDPGGPLGAGVLAGQQSGAIPTNPIGGPVDSAPANPPAGTPAVQPDEKSAALAELATTVAKVPDGSTVPEQSDVGQRVNAAVEKALALGASVDEVVATVKTGTPAPSAFQQREAWGSLPEVEQFISAARQQTNGIEAKPVQREDGRFTFALPGEPEFNMPDARQSVAAATEKQNDDLLKRAEGLTKRVAKAQEAAQRARASGNEELAQRADVIAGKLQQQLDAAIGQMGGGGDAGAAGLPGAGTGMGAGVPQGNGGAAGRSGGGGAPVAGGSGGDSVLPAGAAVAPVAPATPDGVAGNGTGADAVAGPAGNAGSIGNPVVLQNRDRSGAASVAQMAAIAADPDPTLLSFSRDFGTGAPVVFANGDAPQIPPAQFGSESVVVDADRRRIPVRYAVVEASELVPSNRADGTPNDLYTDSETPGLIRAVAGNGRVAGVQQAFAQGTAARYVEGIAADAALHGVDPAVIARMTNPVLVRMMRSVDITPDIGDRSNVSGVSQLNPVEQARTDMARVNLESMEFDESGEPTAEAVRRFVQGMPASEQSGLMDQSGAPGRQAVDRLMAAAFAKAYDSDDLIRLYAQATDPDARNVISALAQAAGSMSKLEGAGEYDVRPTVLDAARATVNAARRGISLAKLAQQSDLSMSRDAQRVIGFFAENARSAKRMAEGLRGLADTFYNEATKATTDMFGEVPRRAPADLYGVIDGQEAQPETTQQPSGTALSDRGTEGQAEREDDRGVSQDGQGTTEIRSQGEGQPPLEVEAPRRAYRDDVTSDMFVAPDQFALAAPTPEDVIRQQEAAERAAAGERTENEERARLDAERAAADQVGFLQPTESGVKQRDTTGDMFGGPTADDVLAQRERERQAAPDPGGLFAAPADNATLPAADTRTPEQIVAEYREKFGKMPTGMTREQFREFTDSRREAQDAAADALVAIAERDGLTMPSKNGGALMMTPEPGNGGKSWRVTRTLEDGTPAGHTEYNTAREAAMELIHNASVEESKGKIAPSSEPGGIERQADAPDKDWFSVLFGQQAEPKDSQREPAAQDKQATKDRLRAALADGKVRAERARDEWAAKTYKKNKTQVELRGDGPARNASMSIGAINENRRRRAIEAANAEIAAIEKIERQIESPDGFAQVAGLIERTMSESKRAIDSGVTIIPAKSVGDYFEFLILDALGIKPERGNYTSNGVSKALRAFAETDSVEESKGKIAPPSEPEVIERDAGQTAAKPQQNRSQTATDAAKRTRPIERIVFKTPIVGPSGAKLTGYQWMWTPESFIDSHGEEVMKRVSNWDEAVPNTETGRDVVHQFSVEVNGEERVVSAESAIGLLGYADGPAASGFKSIATAAKTLARQKMQLAEAEQARAAWQRDWDVVAAMRTPDPVRGETREAQSGGKRTPWSMGRAEVLQWDDSQKISADRFTDLVDFWRADQMRDRGWDFGVKETLGNRVYDLKKRIARSEKRLAQLTDRPALASNGEPIGSDGKTESARLAGRLDSAAVELAGQIVTDAGETDFDPAELQPALEGWAKDANVPADDLRQAVLKRIDQSDLTAPRKAQIKRALDPTMAAARSMAADLASTFSDEGFKPGAIKGSWTRAFGKLEDGANAVTVGVRVVGMGGATQSVQMTRVFRIYDQTLGRSVGGPPSETLTFPSVADALAAHRAREEQRSKAKTKASAISESDLMADATEFIGELAASQNPAKTADEAYRRYLANNAVGMSRGDPVLSLEKFTDAWTQMTAARSAATEARPTAKIGDFGEKIGGAKKDVWQSHKDRMREAMGLDVAVEPLSKSWPAPDYQALLDAGADARMIASIRAMRDAIPAKPRQAWKAKQWAALVTALRDQSTKLIAGEMSSDTLKTVLSRLASTSRVVSEISGRAELYELVGHSKSLADVRISVGEYGLYNGVEYKPPKVVWTVEKKAGATAFGNWPRELASGRTKEEALAAFKAKFDELEINPPAKQETTFEIYSKRGEKAYWIGKKIGRNPALLEGPFATIKEARTYKDAHNAELVAKFEKFKEIPRERRDTNQPRVGEDMRGGQDVTPEMFSDAFAFKGVEFGNWVEQKRRQKDLNDAYDALMDMAAVLGVNPKALSLNGELGLAFGARGGGGVNPAAAHYEPGKVVINLTKKEGAGSLGHEWWHALDNYFARMRGEKSNMMTQALDVDLAARGVTFEHRGAVRREMVQAYGEVMKAIRATAMASRAAKLDAKRSKDYWGTKDEMSARSFEAYLISKLHDQGAANDYLSNIVDEATWEASERLGMELEGSYPYPLQRELPSIRAAFDHFFQTVETRETDKGVALFSRRAQNDAYETDLFGNPVPAAPRADRAARPNGAGLPGNVQSAAAVSDTEAPAGQYHVRTVVGSEVNRRLGADRILTPDQAAAATRYLYRSAVERFDGIVTDADGKPLAVVGGFKGALSQTSVYPATLMGEAVRVPGAARIWFSHNHPSGTAELSAADRNLNSALSNVFRGSGIEPMGLLAVAGEQFAYAPAEGGNAFAYATTNDGGSGMARERTPDSRTSVSVPVIERELVPANIPKMTINSPAAARAYGRTYYTQAKAPGLMLLNAQYDVAGWVPLPDQAFGDLRDTGGLRALYRAVSEANASAAIMVHGGQMDAAKPFPSGVTVVENIGAALSNIDVQLLDVINAVDSTSYTEKGLGLKAGPVYSTAEPKRTGLSARTVERTAKQVSASWRNAPGVVVLESPADAPFSAPSDADGAWYGGKVYLFSRNIPSPRRVVEIMLHEAVGHNGVIATLGERLRPTMQSIYRTNAGVRTIADAWMRDNDSKDISRATEEALAQIAERGDLTTQPFWSRLAAAIRNALRAIGVVREFSDADIRDLMVRAYRTVAVGGTGVGAEMRASRAQIFANNNFWTWWKESKATDEQGNPRRLYRGDMHDFSVFDKTQKGKNTRAQSAYKGFFFAGNPRTAESYRPSQLDFDDAQKLTPENFGKLPRDEVSTIIAGNIAERMDDGYLAEGVLELIDGVPEPVKVDGAVDWKSYIDKLDTGTVREFIRIWNEAAASPLMANWTIDPEFQGNRVPAGVLREFYLSMQNPLVHDFKGEEYRETSYNDLLKRAIRDGHDGAIFKNTVDGGPVDDIYVVFEPTQIKAADNAGTFDPSNPDIRFSRRRGTEAQAREQGFTLKAYRGVSAAAPFNSTETTWATTNREVAEVYAEEVFGYDDSAVIAVMIRPDGLPRHDASRLTDAQREELGADEFGNPQAPGIYDRSDDHPLGSAARNVTVIHAPNDAVFVIDNQSKSEWFSPLRRAIEGINAKAQPAKSWIQQINALTTKGVKADEIEWSGVREFLALHEGKVGKDEVLAFLDANGVRVEDVTYGGNDAAQAASLEFVRNAGYDVEESDLGAPELIGPDGSPVNDYRDVPDAVWSEFVKIGKQDTKFSNYALPGGSNYREVLLTLPSQAPKDLDGMAEKLYGKPYDELTAAQAARTQSELFNPTDRDYQSSHWDQPNVVAHIRLNDRIDAEGKRVLFVEEVQSDWGQAGAKKENAGPAKGLRRGFKGDGPVYDVRPSSIGTGRWEVFDTRTGKAEYGMPHPSKMEAQVAANGANQLNEDLRPPKGPFVTNTDAWVALALKRIVRMAVDGGYDRVAFINGEQSAKRYDLSKQIDRIRYAKSSDRSTVTIDAIKGDRNVFSKANLPMSDLEEIVGKDVAQRIADDVGTTDPISGYQELSGLDLKVGGEGMKAFYDTIVPTVAKGVLKKLGGGQLQEVQVELTTFGNRGRPADWNLRDGVFGAQPGFDVTPAMRDQVLSKGVPLFSRRPSIEAAQRAAAQGVAAARGMTVQKAWKSVVNAWTDIKPLSLQLLGRRQIVEIHEGLLPQLRQHSNEMQQYDADKNESAAAADEIVDDWRKLKDKDALADVMHEATLLGFDPDVDTIETPQQQALANDFAALGEDAKAIYRRARDAYQAHWDAVKQAIGERIQRADIAEAERRGLMEKYRDEFLKPISGVYFPLARFGDYVITATNEDGQRVVVFAEKIGDAQVERARMMDPSSGLKDVGKITLRKEFNAARDSVSKAFVRQLFEAVDKTTTDEVQATALKDSINQLYLTSLPDVSWAKHGLHRKGTPGFNKDARRAFANNMFHGGYYLAKLRHADVLADQLEAMQEHIGAQARNPDFDSVTAQQVLNEMRKRYDATMNPDNNALANKATAAGFIWYLGASPASAVVNLSQTALVAYPIIAAKYGHGATAAELTRAAKQTLEAGNDLRGRLSADENAAIDQAVREGLIDITQAHDLAGIAEGRDSQLGGFMSPVMRVASKLFHEAEKFNRQTTFIAAYRLAKAKGEASESAYDIARDLTYQGHFDYAMSNRPRAMMGPLARTLLLFKQYGQNMVYTLARNAYLSAKGDRQAMKTLAGVLVAHGLAAGTLGLPLSSILFGIASMLGSDDDEPWDAEVAYRNYLADAIGKGPAEVVAKGVFRALMPGDISGRVGLDSLLIRDIDMTLEPNRVYRGLLDAILGPVFGIPLNMAQGAAEVARGDVLRGMERMLPKAIGDGLKAVRYGTEGVKDSTGVNVLDEVTFKDILSQVAGFSPARVREAYDGRRAIYDKKNKLEDRREELLGEFSRGVIQKDDEARLEAIQEIAHFNQVNPMLAITRESMLRSVQNRMRRQVEAQNGIYLPRKQRQLADEGRFANAE